MKLLQLFSIICLTNCSVAQPVLSTMRTINGYLVYDDHEIENKYYVLPYNLSVEREAGGKPKVEIRSYRFEGDQNLEFVNILRLTLSNKYNLKKIKEQVKANLGFKAEIHPIPLKNIELKLLLPEIESSENHAETSIHSKFEDSSNIWESRTYSIGLNNYESQLLSYLIEKGSIGLLVSYTYYAEVIPGNLSAVKFDQKDSLITKELERLILMEDHELKSTEFPIFSTSFSVNIDFDRFPEVFSQQEINPERGDPSLLVYCFDFENGIRPDLNAKVIEVRGVNLRNERVYTRDSFLNLSFEKTSFLVDFNQPVRFDYPPQYRILEIDKKESIILDTGWKDYRSWVGTIDISSDVDKLSFIQKEVLFEADPQKLIENSIGEIGLRIEYYYKGAKKFEKFKLKKDTPKGRIKITYDKSAEVFYWLTWFDVEGNKSYSRMKRQLNSNYLFINPRMKNE